MKFPNRNHGALISGLKNTQFTRRSTIQVMNLQWENAQGIQHAEFPVDIGP